MHQASGSTYSIQLQGSGPVLSYEEDLPAAVHSHANPQSVSTPEPNECPSSLRDGLMPATSARGAPLGPSARAPGGITTVKLRAEILLFRLQSRHRHRGVLLRHR